MQSTCYTTKHIKKANTLHNYLDLLRRRDGTKYNLGELLLVEGAVTNTADDLERPTNQGHAMMVTV